MSIIEDLKKMKIGQIYTHVNLKKYTSYKLEGKALVLVIPSDVDALIQVLDYSKKNDIKYKILGNGSNLIFSDNFYEGILIKLDAFQNLEIKGNKVTVGAGYSLVKLSLKTASLGLSGLEFASGIPGTVGGAVYMNAGAYNSDMGYVVKRIRVLTPDFEVITMENEQLDFHYRTSFLMKNSGFICLEAEFLLKNANKEEILEIITDRKQRRMASQPLEYPSAGSVFRNPTGDYAGRLIEAVGLKGYRIGDAMVSEKHANFIINVGHAKGSDIKKLICEIQKKVKEEYGIELKVEQEFVE